MEHSVIPEIHRAENSLKYTTSPSEIKDARMLVTAVAFTSFGKSSCGKLMATVWISVSDYVTSFLHPETVFIQT